MEKFGNIYCNLRTCNRCLDDGYAWITVCSHVFCNEDGEKLFKVSLSCPLCLKELDSKTDLVRIKLKPTEQYCNMILCGQRPEVILDICSKGLAFWFNQMTQQSDYIKYMADTEREKRLAIEKIESDSQLLFKKMQAKHDELKKENEYLKKLFLEKAIFSGGSMDTSFGVKSSNGNVTNQLLQNTTAKIASPELGKNSEENRSHGFF